MKTPAEQTFGPDEKCFEVLAYLALFAKQHEAGPFRDGFEAAIKAAGAYLDKSHGDGGQNAEILMDQMIDVVRGRYILTRTGEIN